MQEMLIEYQDQAYTLEGYVATESLEKKPAVIIFHAFHGRDEFVCNIARKLAKLGYVGFAADVYGKGIFGQTREECFKLMNPYLEERAILRGRVMRAYEAVHNLEYVKADQIAAIGYCFGGLCALDLARSGASIKAAVSFHGILKGLPEDVPLSSVKAKILACHGALDPMVPSEQIKRFEEEMEQGQVDWQLHIYGSAMHAFTNPAANDADFGTVYHPDSDHRSWKSMLNLLEEVF